MTHSGKRYPPAYILVELVTTIKNLAGLYLLLFILKANSTAGWVIWGRNALLVITAGAVLFIFIKWFFNRYELGTSSIIFTEGVFVKKQNSPVAADPQPQFQYDLRPSLVQIDFIIDGNRNKRR